jgi:lipopolysaccharide export LptBFGC system permease protein LptF
VQALRTIYRYWAVVVFVAVLTQVGAAGYGAFYVAKRVDDTGETLTHEQFENGWDFHSAFGYVVVIGILVLLVLALASRMPRPHIWAPVALAVAGILQIVWAEVGRSVNGLGFLHPINALFIFALAGLIAHRTWRTTRTRA